MNANIERMVANMITYLSYGAIGLGLALSVLAFNLIRSEQKIVVPRLSILIASYFFMVFSIIMSVLGFSFEYISKNESLLKSMRTISDLTAALDNMKDNAEALKNIVYKFEKMKSVLDSLTSIKGDKLTYMQRMQLNDANTAESIRELKTDLTNLNRAMRKELALID